MGSVVMAGTGALLIVYGDGVIEAVGLLLATAGGAAMSAPLTLFHQAIVKHPGEGLSEEDLAEIERRYVEVLKRVNKGPNPGASAPAELRPAARYRPLATGFVGALAGLILMVVS